MKTKKIVTHDAYSFDPSSESLDKSYQAISAGYHRIFDRLGLDYLLAEAWGGVPGSGDPGHVNASNRCDRFDGYPAGIDGRHRNPAQNGCYHEARELRGDLDAGGRRART